MQSSNHRLSLGSQSSSADEQEMFASFDKLVVEQTGSASHFGLWSTRADPSPALVVARRNVEIRGREEHFVARHSLKGAVGRHKTPLRSSVAGVYVQQPTQLGRGAHVLRQGDVSAVGSELHLAPVVEVKRRPS